MGVSVSVVAIKRISEEECKLVDAYNTLCENGVHISTDLKVKIGHIIGKRLEWDEPISLGDGIVEIGVKSEGDAEYGEGMFIPIAGLPPGTVALRVYMS